MIDLRKGVKTTITLIIYSSHAEMIAPYVCGDRVNFRRYIGYCEIGDSGKNRNYVFKGYTNEPSYTIDELPISGEAQFQVGKGIYSLTWE
jgi:hypothetical protein